MIAWSLGPEPSNYESLEPQGYVGDIRRKQSFVRAFLGVSQYRNFNTGSMILAKLPCEFAGELCYLLAIAPNLLTRPYNVVGACISIRKEGKAQC